ncbi:hypothetical protein PR202_gb24349 [Eleusine coracana subsp. coracana]|uniref:Uncharacterized protein n=1 Tax=Eleusine coracana subsp. coracana TaxID=191504 RepID=A0AAV5FKS0_ELECO|nr:hypothetical protein PR202_gb24349 [Eleusine coracana subsp. coracana]
MLQSAGMQDDMQVTPAGSRDHSVSIPLFQCLVPHYCPAGIIGWPRNVVTVAHESAVLSGAADGGQAEARPGREIDPASVPAVLRLRQRDAPERARSMPWRSDPKRASNTQGWT